MPLPSYVTLYGQILQAISDVLTKGQEVTWDGRTYTRANIDGLQRLAEHYRPLAEREERGGRGAGGVRYVVPM